MNPLLMEEVSRKSMALAAQSAAYATALVVRCESPTSAKPGASGIITADGAITGWIGGGCAQPIVIEEALSALRDGNARLVRITPKAGSAEVNGIRTYEMVCHSGGTLDIFIEPVHPQPRVLIFGRSPVVRTLARLARPLGYPVTVLSPLADPKDFEEGVRVESGSDITGLSTRADFVVVSSQGEDDEGALESALAMESAYIGFVASPKKWQAVSAYLIGRGLSADQLARVQVPAGLAINAVDPEEIALSIMAQIVSIRRAEDYQPSSGRSTGENPTGQPVETAPKAIDPICNMTVDIATARHTSQFQGQTVYFCCPGCKARFEANPAQYAQAE